MVSCIGCRRSLRHPVKYCPYCGTPQANAAYTNKNNEQSILKGFLGSIRFVIASVLLALVLAACGFLSSMAFGALCLQKSDALIYLVMSGMVGFFGTFTALCFIYFYCRFLRR